MKHLLIFLLLFFSITDSVVLSAHPLIIRFVPLMNDQPLILEQKNYAVNEGKDSIRVSTLRYYISGIALYENDKLAWSENDSYHLMDVESEKMNIVLNAPTGLHYNKLHFNVGMDSATNAAGAKGGDLDATKGMYWAWQSGYINFKLEGSSPLCKTRKNAFEFHLGGFTDGNYCMQSIILSVNENNNINIATNVDVFLKHIDLSKQNMVIIPGAEAVGLSKLAAGMFQIISAK